MANVYDIIIRPIITERSMEATGTKKYVFEVAPTAGKIEIKNFSKKKTTFLKKNRNFFKNVLVFFIVTNAS